LGTIVTVIYYWWIISTAMNPDPVYYDYGYDYLD
jgi:hypothetical protein